MYDPLEFSGRELPTQIAENTEDAQVEFDEPSGGSGDFTYELLSGMGNSDLFELIPGTRKLRFRESPNYEAPLSGVDPSASLADRNKLHGYRARHRCSFGADEGDRIGVGCDRCQ